MALVLTNDVPRRWIDQPDGGGVTDHGLLTGLGDDDHAQYTTDAELTTALAGYQPAGSYQVTTEKDQPNGYAALDGAGQFVPTKVKYATTIDRGAVLIAGDLGGSGSAPTVPGLAGKETAGAASAAITTHVAAGDPHTQYLNNARGDARYPQGKLIAWNAGVTVATGANATEVIALTTTVAVLAGRTYMVSANGELLGDNTGTLAAARLRYTTDGTAPTITSTLLGRFLAPITQSNGTPNYMDFTRKLDIAANGTLRVALTINREVGTTGLVQINSGVVPQHIYIFDAGPTLAAAA